jgi:hypothetical protein
MASFDITKLSRYNCFKNFAKKLFRLKFQLIIRLRLRNAVPLYQALAATEMNGKMMAQKVNINLEVLFWLNLAFD